MSHETYSEKNNKSITNVSLISLDDLLLRREERERGSIFPELDVLFSGQTVLLGGPQIAEQAKAFLNQAEKKIVKVPSLGLARIFHRSLLRKPGTPMAAALDLNFDQDSMDSYSPDKNSASALPYHPLRLSRRESDEISWLELTFLLVILLLLTKIQALSWIDFLLVLLGVACCCIALDAWMLHARGNIFPLIVPCGLLVIAIFRKVFYCTKKMK